MSCVGIAAPAEELPGNWFDFVRKLGSPCPLVAGRQPHRVESFARLHDTRDKASARRSGRILGVMKLIESPIDATAVPVLGHNPPSASKIVVQDM